MSDHPARAAAAAAHIRDLAQATTDPRSAYADPAQLASVTGSLLDLARHLEDALDHLERGVRHTGDGDWAAADGGAPRRAEHAVQSARAEARNMSRALARAVEALGRLKSAP
ncbi:MULTISPECIES: hypothetical protein [unclassified Streptomyces]|uniref:hypothetical protein n=1 Tax=unclassified Streptomyces TaxID=2593676 RepID=UPI000568B4BE|nr:MULTISPECIES: hypothetical protein [unclassified Streptomyces]APU40081.1 hypothetical protein BSL84_10185 [Streptomyces sp. TN58]KJK50989.1 hypothetical protein UK14_12185 [Streptomyces sp. NRRL F-4428]